MQSPMMELDPSKFVYREDKLVKSSFSDFKTDGNPDAAIVQEVCGILKRSKPFHISTQLNYRTGQELV